MKSAALLAVLAIAGVAISPALGAGSCTMEHAVYREPQTGITLAFRRPSLPEDPPGMIVLMFDLAAPPDAPPDRAWTLSGMVSTNMGISREEGTAFAGCPDDREGGYVAVTEDCTVWNGVIYALADGGATPLPFPDEPAPTTLLLSDFGRQLRYNGPLSDPGEAPWDVFAFERCDRP